SSSSAISMGSDVYVPCPISITGITNVTLPARSMRRNAFGANGASVVRLSRTSPRTGRPKPSINPPPIAAEPLRKARRENDAASRLPADAVFISTLLAGLSCRLLDRRTDTRIRAAAADVTGHRAVDIGIARPGRARQQSARGHDLPGLAVPALRNVQR